MSFVKNNWRQVLVKDCCKFIAGQQQQMRLLEKQACMLLSLSPIDIYALRTSKVD
jgi:hypothetical protein